MPEWKRTIELKQFLSGRTDPATQREAAQRIHEALEADRLRRCPDDEDVEQISDEFHTITIASDSDLDDGCARWFNSLLESLYDWADTERVWIGGD